MPQQQLVEKQQQEQQQKETLREETRRKESFSGADISTVADNRIDVTLTKRVMTAEATLIKDGDDEQKVMNFDEEEVEQTHTLPLEDAIYEQFKASPWTVLADMVEHADVQTDTWEPSPWNRLRHLNLSLTDIAVPEQTPTITPTVPVQAPDTNTAQPVLPDPVEYDTLALEPVAESYYEMDAEDDTAPYKQDGLDTADIDEYHELDEELAEYDIDILLLEQNADGEYLAHVETEEGQELTVLDEDTVTDLLYDADTDAEQDAQETAYEDTSQDSTDTQSLDYRVYDPDATEHGLEEEISYTVTEDSAGNAAEVLESLFEETDLSGSVETMTYQDTEDDFETKEAYWAEIDGMDMYRTEFFVNGELAADSLDAYDLDAGDTLTFVEADVFDDDGDDTAEGGACGGDLYLDDLLEDAEDATVMFTEYSDSDGLDEAYAPTMTDPFDAAGYDAVTDPQYA